VIKFHTIQWEVNVSVIGVRHAGTVVQDMDAMLHFYRDFLGFKVCEDFVDASEYVQAITGVKGAHIHTVNLKAPDGAIIQLQRYRSHPQAVSPARACCDVGLNHLAVQVDDIHEVYGVLSNCGVTFTSEPKLSSQGIAIVTACHDPEGNIIELVEMVELPGD